MQAVRIHQYGGPEVLTYETDVPDPEIRADSVLIEMTAASVNPIDWKVRSGARQADFPLKLPAILGRDVSGIVRAVGANVRHFKVGDRVMGLADATYAELVSADAQILTHVPDGLRLEDAAAVPLAALTGDQLVRLATGASPGQVILVSGALGSVGRAAVQTARKLGASVIAGVRSNQLQDATALGVAGVVAIDDQKAVAQLPPVDGVADTVGGDTAARLFSKVRKGGRFGYASVLPNDAAATNPGVQVTRVFARPDPAKVREFADDLRDGRFRLPVSQFLPLREAARAHALMEKGGGGKIVLVR